jgi:putative SOS response-associated peptidase YedK
MLTDRGGRAKLEGDISEIKIAFRVPADFPTPNFASSGNVAPTDNLPIVRYDAKAGHRTLDLMRWSLIPYWSKDIKMGFSTINAMAETVDPRGEQMSNSSHSSPEISQARADAAFGSRSGTRSEPKIY